MNWLLVFPLLVPLATAGILLVVLHRRPAQRWVGLAGALVLCVATLLVLGAVWRRGIQVEQVGGWPFPVGITLVADLFSATMLAVTGLIGLAVAVYSLFDIDTPRESLGYYPLYHVLLAGVCGAFLAGDLFNLFVWFEVLLMASFVLLALGGERAQLEGAIKYVAMNLLASALFLSAVGLLYGLIGTLNLADLAHKLGTGEPHPKLVTTVAMLLLVAFGIKAGVFPLFFWLPASYHTPPVAVSAVFAGLLTKVGVYALIRVFTLLFVAEPAYTHGLILLLAGLTMVIGVLGALAQNEFRKILSFHIISQIGYMVMGLGLAGLVLDEPAEARYALAASVFYIVHHILVKTNLFLASGVAWRIGGTFELERAGGMYAASPLLAALFLVPALSLAGIPPLSGFFAKLALLQAGLRDGRYLIVAVALVVSLLTLLSMLKIWREVFWKPQPACEPPQPGPSAPAGQVRGWMLLPLVVLAAGTIAIGLGAGLLMELALRAAEQMIDRDLYLEAVRGGFQGG